MSACIFWKGAPRITLWSRHVWVVVYRTAPYPAVAIRLSWTRKRGVLFQTTPPAKICPRFRPFRPRLRFTAGRLLSGGLMSSGVARCNTLPYWLRFEHRRLEPRGVLHGATLSGNNPLTNIKTTERCNEYLVHAQNMRRCRKS